MKLVTKTCEIDWGQYRVSFLRLDFSSPISSDICVAGEQLPWYVLVCLCWPLSCHSFYQNPLSGSLNMTGWKKHSKAINNILQDINDMQIFLCIYSSSLLRIRGSTYCSLETELEEIINAKNLKCLADPDLTLVSKRILWKWPYMVVSSILATWKGARSTNMGLLLRIMAKVILELFGPRFELSQLQKALKRN